MESEAPPNRPAPRWTIALLLALALIAAVGFAWQRKTTRTLTAENQQVTQALQQTQAQLNALQSKIDAMAHPGPVVEAAKPTASIGVRKPHAVHRVVHHRQPDDPRWKQFQSRLGDQGKQIDATRQDLASARTELNGSIARTHDQLVNLERKGERSYFEFDINKSKQFRATGPVGIRLKKANTKHSYADLELMVDDADLSKKHVNLYEPVTFYATDEGRPVELVINSISKDRIHGYVATPKYNKTELASMQGSVNSGGDAAPTRKKLELPKN